MKNSQLHAVNPPKLTRKLARFYNLPLQTLTHLARVYGLTTLGGLADINEAGSHLTSCDGDSLRWLAKRRIPKYAGACRINLS